MTILLNTILFCHENRRNLGARERFTDGVLEVYMRIGGKAEHPGCVFLHIPDVFVEEKHRSKGLFTAYIDALELIRPLHGIAFFGVYNERLAAFLEHRNYMLVDFNDYVKVWT
jgi:GNAT superfamily N-acetyltransferase